MAIMKPSPTDINRDDDYRMHRRITARVEYVIAWPTDCQMPGDGS
jgi:hypothetical protein